MTAARFDAGATVAETLVDDLSRTQIVQYAGASGDFNPLHTDEPYANDVGNSPTVFAHGMLVAGMVGEAVARFAGNGFVRQFGGRFESQVWPGDRLEVEIEVVSDRSERDGTVIAIQHVTRNQHAVSVFSGTAEIMLGSEI